MATCEAARSLILALLRSSEEGNFVPRDLIIENLLADLEDVVRILSCQCHECSRYRYLVLHGRRNSLYEELQLEPFAKLILEHAVSFFALLVSLKKGVLIIPFLHKERFDDQILEILAGYPSQCVSGILDDVLDHDAVRDLENEIELQWTKFLRPILSGTKHKAFLERQLLPIYESRPIERRASGCVYTFKVYEHYNQINKHVTGSNVFVRKELTDIDHGEVNVLWNLKEKLEHPHIVSLSTSYEHRGKTNLVFPRSDTNLHQFLRNPRQGLGQSNFANIFRAPIWTQTARIIHALYSIHDHGDRTQIQAHYNLKPENILVNIDRRGFHFLIADFGLSVRHDSTSEGSKTKYGGGDNRYRPPEDRDLNRSYDIWSMGCIFLEIFVFVIWGFGGVSKLDEARGSPVDPFWERQSGGVSLKARIKSLLEAMKKTSREVHPPSRALSPRNELFIQEMAELIERLLTVRPADRPSSKQLLAELIRIQKGKKQTHDIHQLDFDPSTVAAQGATDIDQGFDLNELERQLILIQSNIGLDRPRKDEVELGIDKFTGLISICTRPNSRSNREDERVAVQVFQQTYNDEIKLRYVLTHSNGKTSTGQRASQKWLYLVPAYALREGHKVPRYPAGLELLEDVSDNESGLSCRLGGDLQELQKIHGILLNQEIRHSIIVPYLKIQIWQSRQYRHRFIPSSNQANLCMEAESVTVQLWRDTNRYERECRLVCYISKSKILVVKFTKSLGFERQNMNQEVPILQSYLNKGAISAVFSTIESEAENQPAFPLDPRRFQQLCIDKQNYLQHMSITFEDFDARRDFIDTYRDMKKTWEYELDSAPTLSNYGRRLALGYERMEHTEDPHWATESAEAAAQATSPDDSNLNSFSHKLGMRNKRRIEEEKRTLLSLSSPRNQAQKLDFMILIRCWTVLKEYLAKEFDNLWKLDDIVVVICDKNTDAWCTTCKSYISWRWGALGIAVLTFINSVLDVMQGQSHHAANELNSQTLFPLIALSPLSSDPETPSISIRGSRQTTEIVADILGWMFDALRFPDVSGEVGYKDELVVVQIDQQTVYTITTQNAEAQLLPNSSCWHALFPKKAISVGSIPERPSCMRGLEIDYPLLISISGVDLPTIEDDGIYLDGPLSALYPIEKDSRSQALQWHLQTLNMPQYGGSESDMDEDDLHFVKSPPRTWYRTRVLADLTCFERHFVGWCSSAVVTFGTSIQHLKCLDWSDAKIHTKAVIETTTNLNLNLTFHGVGATAGRSVKRGKTERNPYENHEENLRTALIRAGKNQVLLLRWSTKQAWLIPKSSFLLQLVQSYMAQLMTEDPDLSLPLYFAEASYDGGWSAYQALWNHRNEYLPLGTDAAPCLLLNIVRMFLHALEKLTRSSEPGNVYGWEMKDVIDPPELFDMKKQGFRRTQLPGLGGWNRLLKETRLAFFFEGLDDPIVAGENDGCIACKRIPRDRNLLGVTMVSLKHFTRRFRSKYLSGGGQLTENCYWDSPKPLFGTDCNNSYEHRCSAIQRIFLHERCHAPSSAELSRGEKGAVIFEPCGLS